MTRFLRYLPALGLVCLSTLAQADGAFNQTDRRFVTDAANAGVYEVQAAQVAVKRAQSADVKAFAQMLLSDHEKANVALEKLAASRSMELPRELPHELRGRVQGLEREQPEKFDREFVQKVGMDDHDKDIRLFENAVAKSTDPELKSFAVKTLPELKQHRQHAQGLIGKLR
ncbi:DUF4142 domain-containing protein [Xylophilus sp. GOD-11R]|uniref:DUF4142 domain-containing protein n=1 Tax=Xylophilus sp. GOD-11R TaxID=3089814 RepID=UPI00298D22AC|nr:DUF4142 domain-containing protein [Xylophilus sp. GOD-11R]WPB58761.1 DUF4142 domain-containing protein [Xylophilus sp. GOD-11R]